MWKLGTLWWKFKKEIMMVWTMLRNPAAPAISKLVALLAAVYIISPVDLVPDVIPILGWIDDGVITLLLFQLAFKLLPKEMYESLKAQFEKKGGTVNDAAFKKSESTKAKVDDVVDVTPKN
ncbi:MAG: hypothetical protein RIS97_309 [Pseudomonadota bacterium]